MKRLRIACVLTHVGSGGAQGAMKRLAAELRQRGHDVRIVFMYAKTASYQLDQGEKILLEAQRPSRLDYLRIVSRLVAEFRSFRPDAAISFLPLANVIGQLAAALCGVPARVASQRNPNWSYFQIMRILDRISGTVGLYSDVVPNSESVRESFSSYPSSYTRRMTIIRNGIDWTPSALTKEEARAVFGLPRDKPVIANVARLYKEKNHALLLDILGEIPEAHLAIAGDGTLRDSLEAKAAALEVADRVHFLGSVARERIPDLLKAADLFVLPSSFEGHSNALLEALSAGLPAVVSAIPANIEAIGGGDPVGIAIPLSEPRKWIAEIRALLADGELRDHLGRKAEAYAAEFSIERMVDGFERILLARGQARGDR